MPTPNFNLPLINGASPINIVSDMNALATAVDSSLALLATNEQIAQIKQIATNALTAANSAEAAASKAEGEASAANETAVVAQSSANSASALANSANNKASKLEANANDENTWLKIGGAKLDGNAAIDVTVLINSAATKFKIYGYTKISNGTLSLVSIPGFAGKYGYKIDCGNALAKTGFSVVTGGIYVWDAISRGITRSLVSSVTVGTDGNPYILAQDSAQISVGATDYFITNLPACMYVNANLGDTPTPSAPAQ